MCMPIKTITEAIDVGLFKASAVVVMVFLVYSPLLLEVPVVAVGVWITLIVAFFAYLELFMYQRNLEKLGFVRRAVGRPVEVGTGGWILIGLIGLAAAIWAFLGQ